MNVMIAGGTGFIGRRLTQKLLEKGHRVIVLTRDLARHATRVPAKVMLIESLSELNPLMSPDVIVNLTGENLSARRWSAKQKELIRTSRLRTTRDIVEYIANARVKPRLFLSGSAIGYYGAHGDERLDENGDVVESDFASTLCRDWEGQARRAESDGVRVCLLRTGLVLGPGGGMLTRLLPIFRNGLGGRLGDGKQWMSWIHIEDVAGLILHIIETKSLVGPINATAPESVTNTEFTKTLARVVRRPAILPMPAFALRLMTGEMSRLLLTGQRVVPKKAVDTGYRFRYPTLFSALQACIPQRRI